MNLGVIHRAKLNGHSATSSPGMSQGKPEAAVAPGHQAEMNDTLMHGLPIDEYVVRSYVCKKGTD